MVTSSPMPVRSWKPGGTTTTTSDPARASGTEPQPNGDGVNRQTVLGACPQHGCCDHAQRWTSQRPRALLVAGRNFRLRPHLQLSVSDLHCCDHHPLANPMSLEPTSMLACYLEARVRVFALARILLPTFSVGTGSPKRTSSFHIGRCIASRKWRFVIDLQLN